MKEEVLKSLRERRENILSGGVNRIPTPFERFSRDFVGIEKSCYYTITGGTKTGKSQFTSYLFLYKPLMYAYKTGKVSIKIIYFAMEETQQRILERFMSWLLYEEEGIRVSPRDLRSTVSAVGKDVLDALSKPGIQKMIDYFESHVEFVYDETNPTGIYKWCKRYAEEHGTVKYKTVEKKDEPGNPVTVELFESYQPSDDDYRLIVIDTINLTDCERGMTQKQSMDKLSEYCAKYLRNRYGFSPVIIQQQAFDSEKSDNIKFTKGEPSLATLGDTKYTSRDANVVLALYSPFRFRIPEYSHYDITRFKDRIRFLKVLVNRDGEMGGVCPLLFYGDVCHFEELPRWDDAPGMRAVYKRMDGNDGEREIEGLFLLVSSIKNMFTKNQSTKQTERK